MHVLLRYTRIVKWRIYVSHKETILFTGDAILEYARKIVSEGYQNGQE